MKTKAQIATMLSTFLALAATAEAGNITAYITEPVSDYTVVKPGESTGGTLTVNVNGSESDSPYTVSGTFNLNAGGDIYTDNWSGTALMDKGADAVILNVNSGTIQTKICGQTTAGTNVYGNVVMNINGGILGKGTQQTADCNIISGLGTYAVTEPTVVIYGNNTLNIGSAGSAAEQPTIYGYITTQQSAIVKGDTYLNIRGGHITQEANTYSNVYAGPNYGGIVEGSVYVNISGGTIDRNVHGGALPEPPRGR